MNSQQENVMSQPRPWTVRAIAALEIIYSLSILALWVYFDVPARLWPYALLLFVLAAALTIYLLGIEKKIGRYLGAGLVVILIAGTVFVELASGVETTYILFTCYAFVPVAWALLTWFRKKWLWRLMLVFHALLLVAAAFYIFLEFWTGAVDVVLAALIVYCLLQKDSRAYFDPAASRSPD